MDESVSKSCRNERYCEICQSLSGNFGCNSNVSELITRHNHSPHVKHWKFSYAMQVYPVHRLSCHQCSGNLISNCSIENLNPKACRTYTDFERCYIRKTSNYPSIRSWCGRTLAKSKRNFYFSLQKRISNVDAYPKQTNARMHMNVSFATDTDATSSIQTTRIYR